MQEQNEINLNRAPAWRAFRAAAPQTLPVFAGYWVLGLGYGIYVQSLGLPVWMPLWPKVLKPADTTGVKKQLRFV